MLARIFSPAKTAMQSGRAATRRWVLAFEPAAARLPDPLMGWTQTSDTEGQVRLDFDSREDAVAYAQRRGLAFEVLPDAETKRLPKAYADNFAFQRKQPWTH
jgi:hypothetical protein